MNLVESEQSDVHVVKDHNLDFDLALFNTYAATFKKSMRFVFQTIMYRTLRQGRYDLTVKRFQETNNALAFKKMETFQVGLLMKSLLQRTSINVGSAQGGFAGSICEEFGIKSDQLNRCIEQCVAFWKKVFFITTILRNKEAIGEDLSSQFVAANEFLINKLRELGKTDQADELSE